MEKSKIRTLKQPSLDELNRTRIQQAVASIPIRLRKIDKEKDYTLEELEDMFEIRISENLLSYLENKSKWQKDKQGNYKLVEIYGPLKKSQITEPAPEKNLTPPEARQKLKEENEGPGRYTNLNKFESDLLDYLKSFFNEAEFIADDIKFQNARVRGRSKMWEHLTYLVYSGYLEKSRSEYAKGKYYHYYRLKPKPIKN